MMREGTIEIQRDRRGYYTLRIDGRFEGNFDTAEEAAREAEDRLAYERVE